MIWTERKQEDLDLLFCHKIQQLSRRSRGSELIIEGLVVQILAPIVHMMLCPWPKDWNPIAPNGKRQQSAIGVRVWVWMDKWKANVDMSTVKHLEEKYPPVRRSPVIVQATFFLLEGQMMEFNQWHGNQRQDFILATLPFQVGLGGLCVPRVPCRALTAT